MGFCHNCCQQLASVDLVVAHGGLPVFWAEELGTPPDQRDTACAEYRPAFFGSARNDRGVMAEHVRGLSLLFSSPSRLIRGLGRGAERCAQHVILDSDLIGV